MEVPWGAGKGDAIFFFSSMLCCGALLVSTFLGIAGEFPFSKNLSGNGELSLLLEPMLLSDESESESEKVTVLFWFSLFSNCKFDNDLTCKRFNTLSMQVPS